MNIFKKLVCLDAYTIYPHNDSHWSVFDEYADELVIYDRTAPAEVPDRIKGAEAILVNKVVITPDIIAANPQLRYIGVLATGYNNVDIAAANAAGITVCNIPAYSTAAVAQTAASLLLELSNHVGHYAARNAAGDWCRCEDFSYRDYDWHILAGKKFGVVGFGNTGRATAAIAAGLGMQVQVYTSKPQDALPNGYLKVDMDTLFATSDVVSLHCPLTPSTHQLVNSHHLAMMKPTAFLINTSRGPVVDEDALAEALKTGTIAGAGLDVLCQEPASPSNPLIGAPNCIITPHLAWTAVEALSNLFDIALENVRAFLVGKPQNYIN